MPAQAEKSEKEILNELLGAEEKFPVIVEEEPKVEKEVEPLVKKLEEEIYLTQPVTDDVGQPLVSSPAPQQPVIILPLTQDSFNQGLKQKVSTSIRWLVEWCRRLIKILGPQAIFREERGSV